MMTTIKQAYEDAANVFDVYADDQIAARRWQATIKDRRECEIRATVWREAANELRNAVKDD